MMVFVGFLGIGLFLAGTTLMGEFLTPIDGEDRTLNAATVGLVLTILGMAAFGLSVGYAWGAR